MRACPAILASVVVIVSLVGVISMVGMARVFRASLYMLRTEEGGRRSGVSTGYRTQTRFVDDQPWDNDGVVFLEDCVRCMPGEECMALVEFIVPRAVTVSVERGVSFILREGGRAVARGTVVEVVALGP